MRNTLAIALKEIKSYFSSPMAYVVAAVFLVLSGLFFAQYLSQSQTASMVGFFAPGSFFLLLMAPILTMRLLAEEHKMGTLELLLTAPVRDTEVVLGKFLASFIILLGMLFFTLYYPLLLVWFGDPDIGPIFTGYLGLILMGSSFLSAGLLASSMTSNQLVAAVLALGILIIFWVIGMASSLLGNIPGAGAVLNYLTLGSHFQDPMKGVIDTVDLVYFASFIVTALFLTVRSLETRRWR